VRESESRPIRRSPFAGTWYPADPFELGSLVDRFLEDAPRLELPGKLFALISPHAGLAYSGPVAGAGYRLLLDQRFDTSILLGPSHRRWFDALAVYPQGAFATPLGLAQVDSALAEAFSRETPRARVVAGVHEAEHSLEMQLPFLQRVLPEVSILPVVMGNQSRENIEAAASAIACAVSRSERSTLVVASSDLSHYRSRDRARELDSEVLDCVARFDPDALEELLETDHDHACGGGPIVAVMRAARALGATHAKVLHYADSGDVTGDTDAVVGYLSAALFGAA
jgi:AmmeMemoRadiSam system protein B